MKSTKILFLPALTMVMATTKTTPLTPITISTFDIYGPFLNTEDCYFKFKCNRVDKVIHGTIRGYNNKYNTYVMARNFDISNGESSNIQISTKGRISTEGLRLELSFTDNETFQKEFTTVLYQRLENIIVANKKTISLGGALFGMDNNSIINEETYNFEDTNEYYSTKEGNKLDVSEISFDYFPIKKYSFSSAYLEIIDNQNIFREVRKYNKKAIRIPLVRGDNSSVVSFKIKSRMYVNEKTLEMSSNYHDGLAETDDFFVPLGYESIIEDYQGELVIIGSGFNGSTVRIPLSFYNANKLLGSCGESEYCIEGGIRE